MPSFLLFARPSGLIPLRSRSVVFVTLKTLMAVLASTSLPALSESWDILVAYNPQRFIQQFRLDQGAVVESGNICIGVREAEAQYTRVGRDCLLSCCSSIFWPSLVIRGVRLPGGVLHCARCIEAFTEFVSPQSVVPR